MTTSFNFEILIDTTINMLYINTICPEYIPNFEYIKTIDTLPFTKKIESYVDKTLAKYAEKNISFDVNKAKLFILEYVFDIHTVHGDIKNTIMDYTLACLQDPRDITLNFDMTQEVETYIDNFFLYSASSKSDYDRLRDVKQRIMTHLSDHPLDTHAIPDTSVKTIYLPCKDYDVYMADITPKIDTMSDNPPEDLPYIDDILDTMPDVISEHSDTMSENSDTVSDSDSLVSSVYESCCVNSQKGYDISLTENEKEYITKTVELLIERGDPPPHRVINRIIGDINATLKFYMRRSDQSDMTRVKLLLDNSETFENFMSPD